MTPSTIALLAGLLFLLIAVVGGGFKIERVEIPSVPKWGRLVSFFVGTMLVVPFAFQGFKPDSSDSSGSSGQAASAPSDAARQPVKPPPGEVSLYSDNDPDLTTDKIRLSGLDATDKHDPAQVNDRLTISFSLKNTGDQPIKISPFIGARDPAKGHADFAEENENRTFAPGEEVKIKGALLA